MQRLIAAWSGLEQRVVDALRDWHAVKLLLALQGTVATCKARFGGLSDVKALLQNCSDMYLLKLSNSDGIWQTCCTQ